MATKRGTHRTQAVRRALTGDVRRRVGPCEQIATRYFAPHNKTSDAHEPTFDGTTVTVIPEVKEALDAFARADLLSMSMDHHLGGAQLPFTVAGAGLAWFHAANTSTASYVLLTQANANLLAKYGTAEQISRFLKPMLEGRFLGTMCLSETQAGSPLADIVTRAEPRDNGTRLVDLDASAESDHERASATMLLDILTPVAKSWPSQWCLEANSLAIRCTAGTAAPASMTSNSGDEPLARRAKGLTATTA